VTTGTSDSTGGTSSGTARIWWSGLPEVLTEMRGPIGAASSVSFSPEGKWVIAAYGREAWVWEGGTGQRVARLGGQNGALNQATISPDGNWIATLSADGSTWVWNTGTWKTTARLQGGVDPSTIAAFHPEGTHLAVAGASNRLRVWDVLAEELLETDVRFPGAIRSVEYGLRGEHLLVASGSLVYVLDAATGEEILRLDGTNEQVWRAHWSRDGSTILAATSSGLQAWEARTGEPLVEPRGTFTLGDAASADLGRDGRWLVTLGTSHRVSVLSARTGTELMQIPLDSAGTGKVALSSNGRDIAVAGDGVVRIYTCEVCIGARDLLMMTDKRLTRNLTCEERNIYLHTTEVCPTPTE
jgi:WD40 repeat protein